jgi:ribosomal protein L3
MVRLFRFVFGQAIRNGMMKTSHTGTIACKERLSQVFYGPGELVLVTMFQVPPEQRGETFSPGDKVSVLARPKGKGFQGNQKRHGFRRGPMTHGSKNHRLPGSIGAGGDPGRVFPGKKMAGRKKPCHVLTKNLEVLCAEKAEGKLVLKGSTAGGIGSRVLIYKQAPRG